MVSLLCSRKARVLGGEILSEIRKLGNVEEVQKFDEIAKQPMSEGDNSAKSTDPKLSFMTYQTRLVESWKMHTEVRTKLHFMKAPTKMNEKVICFSSLQRGELSSGHLHRSEQAPYAQNLVEIEKKKSFPITKYFRVCISIYILHITYT